MAVDCYSVTELTRRIRYVLQFQVGEVWVEGEVSNHRLQASGHQYFTIKDKDSQLSCVLFRGDARFVSVDIEAGMKLRVFGEISVYQARGQYQLIVRNIREGGVGGLHERFEALKAKLKGEGLFDDDRKKELPSFPNAIAIVTSGTGAALQDMLKVFKRRAPWIRIHVFPVPVQGDGAWREIMDALDELATPGGPEVDAVIVARGGGSIEDLWNFNEEKLARKLADYPLPVVSGVGHETDFTIVDFVVDTRAPTPSAAAELLSPDQESVRERLSEIRERMHRTCSERVRMWEERLGGLARSGAFLEPDRLLREHALHLDNLDQRLRAAATVLLVESKNRMERADTVLRSLRPDDALARRADRLTQLGVRLKQQTANRLDRLRDRCEQIARQLTALGPESVLARGYSFVTDEDGNIVTNARQLEEGDEVAVKFHRGRAKMRVKDKSTSPG